MNNPRITAKERGLLKGAIRRVYSRSDIRRAVINASKVTHSDPTRKRVKTWCRCAICQQPEAISLMVVDHRDPIIPVNSSLEAMSWDTVIDRTWCEENNLDAVCKTCHDVKTKAENKLRREYKKNGQSSKS